MPGEITRAYSAPDGPMPLLPPWVEREEEVTRLIRNDIKHWYAYGIGLYDGANVSAPAPGDQMKDTLLAAYMRGFRKSVEAMKRESAELPMQSGPAAKGE